MEWWQMYLFTRLDVLSNLGQIFGGLFGVLSVFWIAFYVGSMALEGPDEGKETRNALKAWVWVPKSAVIFLLLGLLMPTKEDVAMIYIVPKIANSEIAKELPEDLKMLKDMGIEKLKDILKTEE